ncbi:RidA family protein [Streptomyces sp. NPDC057271]|uniref:RidA family protein n=1 Tax=unclassified Streptomyces TaxID=2593676 RepID=UPI003644B0FE
MRRALSPWTWQEEFGFEQVCEMSGAHRTLWLTGQASTDADGHPVHPGDMSAQLQQTFDNLEEVLRAADAKLSDVVRLVCYTTDVDELFTVWDELRTRLAAGGCRPALTLLGVTRLAYPELLVELEATATVDEEPAPRVADAAPTPL